NREAAWHAQPWPVKDQPIPRWLWKRLYKLRIRYHSLEDTLHIQGLSGYREPYTEDTKGMTTRTDINDPQIANVDGTSHTAGTTEKFKAIVITANRVAREFNDGDLDTCVLTSYALAAALTDLGYVNARPVRVEAASFPDDPKLHGAILGWRGSGRRAP